MNCLLLLASAFTVYSVDPYNDAMYLPNKEPAGGIVTNCVGGAAAQGEIESVSFIVKPERDLAKVDFIPTELKNAAGDVLDPTCIDFALVKVWFRPGTRWRNSWFGDVAHPQLMNNLVIHDDALVKVDEKEKVNYLRFSYDDGERYLNMRADGRKSELNHGLEPIRDAKTFVPFDLKQDRHQQYWLTYTVPENQKPGLYKGALVVKENGKEIERLGLSLEVYPFKLPRPRTHYDTTKEYVLAFYNHVSLQEYLKLTKNLKQAEKKLLGTYRAMATHNALSTLGPGDYKNDTTDDLSVRDLLTQRLAGMTCRPLFAGGAGEFSYATPFGDTPWPSLDKDADGFKASLERFGKTLDLDGRVCEKYLGHHDQFYFSVDECGVGTHRQLFGYWSLLHERGLKVYMDYSEPHAMNWIAGANNVAAHVSHKSAWQWHDAGSLSYTYAAPFTGPESPDTWRRQKGLRFYYADYDGVVEYNWYEGPNRWNDFVYHDSPYCQFGLVYPVEDGVIGTVAWEGIREAMDDVRYFSLFRLRAQAAMKSDDPAIRKLGRQSIIWFDSQDPEYLPDLRAFRAEVAERIKTLIAKVGPQKDELPGSKPLDFTELPPCTYGRDAAANADPLKLAETYEAADRWDLAMPLLDKIRKDAKQDPERRVAAALREATMLAYWKKRPAAVKVLEEAAEYEGLVNAQRGRLLFAVVKTLLTDVVFEEQFTAEQLAAAEKKLDKALGVSNIPQTTRGAGVIRLAEAYNASGCWEQTVAFVKKHLENKALKGSFGALYCASAMANMKLKNFHRASVEYGYAIDEYGAKKNDYLEPLGQAAEADNDLKKAQKAYTDLLPLCDKVENKSRYNRVKAAIARLSKKMTQASKKDESNAFDSSEKDEAIEDISLDE